MWWANVKIYHRPLPGKRGYLAAHTLWLHCRCTVKKHPIPQATHGHMNMGLDR